MPATATVAGFVLVVALQGCAALLAGTQAGERTLPSYFETGASRQVVERELGSADAVAPYEDGHSMATYEYKVAYHPATSRFWSSPTERMQLWASTSAGTWFLAEGVLVPLEIGGKIYRYAKSRKYSTTILYGPDDRVVWAETQLVE